MDYITYKLQADSECQITKQEYDLLMKVHARLKPLKSSLRLKPLDHFNMYEMQLTASEDYGITAVPSCRWDGEPKKKFVDVWVKHTMSYQNESTFVSIKLDYETDLGKHLLEEWYYSRDYSLEYFKEIK